jgi:hypothetical protein
MTCILKYIQALSVFVPWERILQLLTGEKVGLILNYDEDKHPQQVELLL